MLSFSLMRWRNLYFWALAAVVAFAAVPTFHGHSHLAVGSLACVSAPSVPAASIESAPETHPLLSHFDGCSPSLRSTNPSFALRAVRAREVARQIADLSQPNYGPLHRRPPPSFS